MSVGLGSEIYQLEKLVADAPPPNPKKNNRFCSIAFSFCVDQLHLTAESFNLFICFFFMFFLSQTIIALFYVFGFFLHMQFKDLHFKFYIFTKCLDNLFIMNDLLIRDNFIPWSSYVFSIRWYVSCVCPTHLCNQFWNIWPSTWTLSMCCYPSYN